MNKEGIFLIILFISAQWMAAQTCCSGGVPLSNNIGLPNEGKGAFILGLNYDLNTLNTLKAESKTLDDNSRKRLTHSVLLNVGYSFTDRLSIETLFSWVNQSRTITQFGNKNFTETSGIGDAVFLIKYAFPELLLSNSALTLGMGGKAPLGDSDLKTENGIQLTADLQPGSGAWDGIGWASYVVNPDFRPSGNITGSLTYRLTGRNNSYLNNTSTYEFGDELQVNLGYIDQFFLLRTLVSPGLIFKYRKAQRDQVDGLDLPNTGGDWIFVRPEAGVLLSGNFNLNLRMELPLYSHVEGTQLTPTSRITLGLTYSLKTKKNNLNDSLWKRDF
ncbi:hypothetical protein BH23BAC2_BH23BAC2_15640 [soil metagenome]